MLQLEENKVEHREPRLSFLFPTAAFLHRVLRQPTLTNYSIKTCYFKKISFYIGLGTLGCDKIAMYESHRQCTWAFSLHFFPIFYSEMEFLSHSAAESAALTKSFPERLPWWKQTQKFQILSVSLVQSCILFSKISPVLFSEMRSRSYQIKILFQRGQGYTGLFFQHTTS